MPSSIASSTQSTASASANVKKRKRDEEMASSRLPRQPATELLDVLKALKNEFKHRRENMDWSTVDYSSMPKEQQADVVCELGAKISLSDLKPGVLNRKFFKQMLKTAQEILTESPLDYFRVHFPQCFTPQGSPRSRARAVGTSQVAMGPNTSTVPALMQPEEQHRLDPRSSPNDFRVAQQQQPRKSPVTIAFVIPADDPSSRPWTPTTSVEYPLSPDHK
jgi:hypothetical protein